MASGTQRVIHSDFAGIDNTKAPHLIPEGSFNELVNVRPHDGILEQTPKFVKQYDVRQIRSNSPSQLKLFRTIFDTTAEEFKYLCVSETQAWLQDIDALEQTSGTASIVSEQVEIPVMLKTVSVTDSLEDVNSQCLISGFNATNALVDFPNINDTVEVEISDIDKFILYKTVSGVSTPVVPSDNPKLTSGVLIVGNSYNILDFQAGDDFTNVGAAANTTGEWFVATETTPTAWTNLSEIQELDTSIARNVPITGTDYTIYFYNETSQNYDDYNIGDTWTYTRSELPQNVNYDNSPFSFTSYGYDNYFVVSEGSVLKYKDGVIKSVGYAEALKGKHVHLFANKLFISQYGGEADDSYRLRWSDFDDPDLFYKDLNVGEAGELNFLYTFTGSQQNKGITGLSSMLNRLYILFPNAVHFGTYVGGGITMFFEQFKLEQGSPFNLGFIEGHNGLYYVGQDLNFYLNNSQQIIPIGEPVKDEFRADIVSSIDSNYTKVWGFFNEKTEEVCWVYPRYNLGEALQYRMIVYNEFYNTWYYRNLPNVITDEQALEISCVGFTAGNNSRLLWGSYNYIYKDYLQTDSRDVDVLSDDISSSTSADYIIPDGVDVVVALAEDLKIPETVEASTITIVTKDFVYDPTHSNTLETIFMDASWEKAKNVEVFIAVRDLVSAPVSYVSLGTWTPESEDQQIDMLHLSGKVWRYKFVVNPQANANPQAGVNAISGFKLTGWAEDVYVNNLEQ